MADDRRFTLEQRQWYGMEFMGDEFDTAFKLPKSPILVKDVKPLQSGKRVFELTFIHCNYPSGVQDKIYKLQTIERGKQFLLARCNRKIR